MSTTTHSVQINCPTDSHINPTVQIYGTGVLSIGHNVRIDAFCIITVSEAGVEIGNNIHIGAGTYLFGGGAKIHLKDYACTSTRCMIFTSSDDFVAGYPVGPMVPAEYRSVYSAPVTLEEYAAIGCSTIIFPGVTMEWGSIAGTGCVVKDSVARGQVVVGNPQRILKARNLDKLKEIDERLHNRS